MGLLDKIRKPKGAYVLREWNPKTGGWTKVIEFPSFVDADEITGADDIKEGSYYRLEKKVPRGYGDVLWYYPERPPAGGKGGQTDMLGLSKSIQTIAAVKNELAALSTLFSGDGGAKTATSDMVKMQAEMYAEMMKGMFKSMGEVMSPFTMMYGMPEKVAEKMPTSFWVMRDKESVKNIGDAITGVLSNLLGKPISLTMPPIAGQQPLQQLPAAQSFLPIAMPPVKREPPMIETLAEVKSNEPVDETNLSKQDDSSEKDGDKK